MTTPNNNAGSRLTLPLYIVAAFGVLLTIVTEASHHYPIILEICGGNSSGCADVAASSFSRIFGVSVAYWGLLCYLIFLIALRRAPSLILPLAAGLMGAEFYFLWVMATILHTYCLFCLVQFGTVTLLFVLTIFWAAKRDDFILPGRLWAAPAVVLFAFTLLAVPVKLQTKGDSLGGGESITSIGPATAAITVEIYSDYECGHCRRLEPTVDELIKKQPNIRIIFRDFVIRGHKLSPVASSYANAIAFTQGSEAFVKTRTELFENQPELYDYLTAHLSEIEFTDELKEKINNKVDADMKRGEALDIFSTPTLVVYRNGEMIQIIRGVVPYERIARFLKE